jgi:endonuclease-3
MIQKDFDIDRVIKLVQRHVKELDLPWLDQLSRRDRDPFKVLISCILSLRTQDKTTSEATKRLFSLAHTPQDMIKLSTKEIEKAIYPVGFYRVKAERIKRLSDTIVQKYNGKVPSTLEELLRLEGVGRKTANLVITLGYGKDGICVDTHVHRITNRWGYVRTRTPEETEMALRERLPKRYWKMLNGLLVAFGQGICKPISPLCTKCRVSECCRKVGVKRYR